MTEFKVDDVEFDDGENVHTLDVFFNADDVIKSFNNNDETTLSFIMQLLERAGSVELKERLIETINDELVATKDNFPADGWCDNTPNH